ncbi:serine/threonine protein kinase, putative, partial [Hepatocystis sp. ex Piliocolobus tephrosceles]
MLSLSKQVMDFSETKKSVKVMNRDIKDELTESIYQANYLKHKKNDEIKEYSNLSGNNDVLQLPSILHNQIRIIRTNESCFKDYTVLSNLGKGTYAQVWKVKHKLTNKIYAAKILQPNQFPKESYNRIVEMFTKEIINLAICQCPGVIKLHKVIGGKEGWILIQDYANDGTLWKENLANNMNESFLYFIQLFQSMLYIQDMNIVHRDLKPTNILRFNNKKIVIADFGWSEHKDSCNLHPSEWPGTLEINPPEILRNSGPMTEKIDNYALGMNMILFISGRFVCRQKGLESSKVAQTILKTVHNLRHSKPPSRFRENIKAWDLFVKLTASHPDERLSLQDVLDHPWVTEMLNNFSLQNSKFLWHEKVKSRWLFLLSNNWNFFDNISSVSSVSSGTLRKCKMLEKETNSIFKNGSGHTYTGNSSSYTGNTGSRTGNTGSRTGNTGSSTGNTGSSTGNTGSRTGNTGSRAGNTGSRTSNTGSHTRNKDNSKSTIVTNTTSQKDQNNKYNNNSLKKDYEILYYMMKQSGQNKINGCSVKKNNLTSSKNDIPS